MTRHLLFLVTWATVLGTATYAQAPESVSALAPRFIDQTHGLSLEQAIAQALEHEPSLRAARSDIEVARGLRVQAGLRPNPALSFEQREEPAGTDRQTMIGVEWPLDLFRRPGRVRVADREITAAELATADRERLLAADVRMRYGEVLAAVRDVALLDEMVSATQRQHGLLRSRVQEGASPPLERDLLEVELQRLESDRLLQAGRAEAAMFELKRVLGFGPNEPLTLGETLDDVVRRHIAATPRETAETPEATRRADVREAEARVGIAEARIDRARREGRFDVSLYASYMRMDAGFPQFGVGAAGNPERVRGIFHYVTGGAMVRVPLFNRNQGEVAAAAAERAGATAAVEAARLAAETEVAAARARDSRAHEAVEVYGRGAQALARQNLTVVGQSYELGRVTVFDVLAEQRRYLDVERAYTEALRAAYEARTLLRRALGDAQ